MSSVEVTAVVASIISAFASGMDIFRRMKAKQKPRKSRKKPERLTEEEWQIQTSLQHRPREIKAEHDRSLARLGTRFAVGDSTAQTSLNHTLLILNAGLIQILSHVLSNDTNAQALSRRSLLRLSETAAAEAVRALEQLHIRLSSTPQLTLTDSPFQNTKAPKKGEPKSKGATSSSRARPGPKSRSHSFSIIERKRPGPDPLIRGAWVRSKSGNSVIKSSSSPSGTSTPRAADPQAASTPVIVQDMPLSRPSHHRTRSSPTYASVMNGQGPSESPLDNNLSYPAQSPPSYVANPGLTQKRYPSRQPSLLLASPEIFNDLQTTSLKPPTPPPKIPLQVESSSSHHPALPSHLPGSRMRYRPPSVATFLTASTKIGEIPEHRWLINSNNPEPARPRLPWEEQHPQQQKALPYTIPPRLEDEPSPKRKGRGFRFWKKSEQVAS